MYLEVLNIMYLYWRWLVYATIKEMNDEKTDQVYNWPGGHRWTHCLDYPGDRRCNDVADEDAMNSHDKKNLDFLMHASPETIRDWYDRVSEDDIQYALELIQMARLEMSLQESDYHEDYSSDAREEDFSLANSVLSKFTLKGIRE